MAAGAFWSEQGGGSDHLCLPDNRDSLLVSDGQQNERNYVYGVEYQAEEGPALSNVLDHDVPCAVCYTAERVNTIMIPGKINCTSSSWTREYYGYLMSSRHTQHRVSYKCVDVDAEGIPGSAGNNQGSLLYFSELAGSGDELTCVICTK